MDAVTILRLKQGRWGKMAVNDIASRPGPEIEFWQNILDHAALIAAKSKPSMKWMNEAGELLKKSDNGKFQAMVEFWLERLLNFWKSDDTSLDFLKGVIWMSAFVEDESMSVAIGRFATSCFEKVPDHGPRSVKLGNACFYSLSQSRNPDAAAAELVRIKHKSKYPLVRTGAENALGTIAKRLGLEKRQLEQRSLPDFGLSKEGKFRVALGDEAAEITLAAYKVQLQWLGRDGEPRKTVPAEAKRSYPEEIKAVKQKQKDIAAMLAAQIGFIEASYLDGYVWDVDDWLSQCLKHPLRREVTENLVWQLDESTCFLGADGPPAKCGKIRVWHPLYSDALEIQRWRERIEQDKITQPFKQVHREIYHVSTQELKVSTHSDRFSAHLIRQHQFRELCLARSWAYQLQGAWDGWNLPTRTIPNFEITAHFHVDAEYDESKKDLVIISHLNTGKLEFRENSGTIIPLNNVPPIIFSEVARDIDLFTSVASKARNADLSDPNQNALFHEYWQRIIFGELSTAAQDRRKLLQWIIPQLEISQKLKISGNFLQVTGGLRTYLIHIGTGNIITKRDSISVRYQPTGSRLDDIGSKTAGAILPFVGDTILASILAAAIALEQDSATKDKSLQRELERVRGIELSP